MFNDHENQNPFDNALSRLRASMSPQARERADRIASINSQYIGTKRDDQLNKLVDLLVENAAGAALGEPGKRRALFVIGESGSGKSTAIRHLIANRTEFQPYEGGSGLLVKPMVSFDAPSPLTLRLLAKVGIEATGYPVFGRLQENEAWDLFKQRLQASRVLFLHIDEMQHAVKGNNPTKLQHLADTVKSLLQIRDWPLHIILSGVPSIVDFLGYDEQLKNRSMVMEFAPQTKAAADIVAAVVQRIVEKHAGMRLSENAKDEEFVHRLIHATHGAFGTIIQVVRAAVEHVLHAKTSDGKPIPEIVSLDVFAEVYATFTGCVPGQNVFKVKQWDIIVPSNALARMLAKKAGTTKGGAK
jgi:type II secretory pathway predicted ATPase ExeA